MREEIKRLYLHLFIGCLIILVCCYVAVDFTKSRFDNARIEQLLCLDAELSVALLATGVKTSLPESKFDWQKPKKILTAAEVVSLIPQRHWVQLSNGDYKVSFGPKNSPEITGIATSEKGNVYQFERLLKDLLYSSLPHEEKIALIKSMSCISITSYPSSKYVDLSGITGISLVHGIHNEYGFLWRGTNSDHLHYLSLLPEKMLSLSVAIVAIVAVGIAVMIGLIWRELVLLDLKRKTFENITRQIARGQIGLPKGIPDSSGTLKELAYSFDSMSSHIQRLLKVQREMINAISHELRTPIARLRFGLEVVKDEVDGSAVDTITALEDDVEELNTLVDEVLTYGKLEEGSLALNFSSTGIRELVEGIIRHNDPLLQHLTVNVSITSDDEVIADAHHLHRALQNLILNAAKYATSQICIAFSSDNDRWQIDIEDDGPGIPLEDRDKVFIPFQRLDNSRTRASGGYGLGLAIVQRIAFWHGGAVLVDESQYGGAKFSLIWSKSQHQKSLS